MSSAEPLGSEVSSSGETDLLAALIRESARGHQGSFAELYHRSVRRVFGLALRLTGDHKTAEGVTQEVFHAVWEQALRFDPTLSSPMAWLMTLTHHSAAHTIRNKHPQLGETNMQESAETPLKSCWPARELDGHNDPACLNQLTRLERDALTLTFGKCLTYDQAAEQLGVPVPEFTAGVRSGLQRLKAIMRTDQQ